MARRPRLTIIGHPHHITQRGIRKLDIFKSDLDRKIYLKIFHEYSSKYGLTTIGYCLMTNHIHFIVVPEFSFSISKTFKDTHCSYAKYFNLRYQFKGHLFEDRFYSCAMDERHSINAIRYVERNPVEAGIVEFAQYYRWSSALSHINQKIIDPLIDEKSKNIFNSSMYNWNDELQRRKTLDDQNLHELHLKIGLPLGGTDFLEKLKKDYNIEVEFKKPGRPKKSALGV